jgi:hypothetical protein
LDGRKEWSRRFKMAAKSFSTEYAQNGHFTFALDELVLIFVTA